MFYRRKIILALLEVFGGRLEKINLQKLLFLVCKKQAAPTYDFVPYLYGCYSYSAKADLFTMVKRDLLNEDDSKYTKKEHTNYLLQLKEEDRLIIHQVYLQFKNMDGNALMKHTYVHFPYYATHSITAPRLLNQEQLKKVENSKLVSEETILFTIGYEGVSLEAYLNKLIQNDIKVLVDVRSNPLSQKFGFSKSQLMKYCSALSIEYIHFAEVGIQSEYRQELKTQSDYDQLFNAYKRNTLPKTIQTQQKIFSLLKEKKRIALTCFEADICQCHRRHLADAIVRLPEWNYDLKHI